ncbi:hypothetical protein CDD81_2988 [Ophiocordyceps australis]|uniref:Phosphatidylinositol-specific phospholipase C X domain-containing protein n=1 Tax=Ophiocordyceps australis TaxID=1399860 RepID=A0A2C5XCE7_9HYPO|nr:hypothetical protein CDD81_2988 [Ophiocordyceps australis]
MPAHTLTIRNLTGRELQLVEVERLKGEESCCNHLLCCCCCCCGSGDDDEKDDGAAVPLAVEPFRARDTGVRAVTNDGHGQVLRLTLATAANQDEHCHHYQTDILCLSPKMAREAEAEAKRSPPTSTWTAVMRKVDKGRHGHGGGETDLMAIFVASPAAGGPLLAVLASPPLDAWMRHVRDEWPLSMLSIPGTHNSPACHHALPSVRCQAVGVAAQLGHGVRFLDVRVSASPGSDHLSLVHGAFPVSLLGSKCLGWLLDDVYRFLDAHASETVILSLKREGLGKASDGEMAKTLKRVHVDKRPEKWWTEPSIPTLGQARGRIVLVRRFAIDDDMRQVCHHGGGWAIDAQTWPDNCEDGEGGGGCFRIQDYYEVARSHKIQTKIDFSRGQLERAAAQKFALSDTPGHEGAPPPPFFVNFLTASNFFNATCWPERVAAKVNPAVLGYLCTSHGEQGKGPASLAVGSAGTGIVVTDWVGHDDDWNLMHCIVGMNARLQQGAKT